MLQTNDAYALLDKDGNPQYSWWMWPEDIWKKMAAGERHEGVVAGVWRVLDSSSDQFDAVLWQYMGTISYIL